MTIYFDDLEVGDVFETGSYSLSDTEIIEFAEQFDPQPFHIDEDAAEDSIFGELVASGLHTLCIASKLMVEGPFQDIANLGGRGIDSLRFFRPVTPGDTLSAEMEVAETSESDRYVNRGDVTLELRVYNQSRVEVLSFYMDIIMRREADG